LPRTTTTLRNNSSILEAASGHAVTGDHAAQEPARAVDADEAGPAWSRSGLSGVVAGISAREPGTERTDGQAGRAALLRGLLGDLLPDLMPESRGALGAAKGCTRRVEPA
jgi:hypothetical protein